MIRDGKILLNRCPNPEGGSFLVAPGGGTEENESLPETANTVDPTTTGSATPGWIHRERPVAASTAHKLAAHSSTTVAPFGLVMAGPTPRRYQRGSSVFSPASGRLAAC